MALVGRSNVGKSTLLNALLGLEGVLVCIVVSLLLLSLFISHIYSGCYLNMMLSCLYCVCLSVLGFEASAAWNDKANVSDKPGETTQLCFYGVGGWTRARSDQGTKARFGTPALVVTDMPGFGFAFLNEGTPDHYPFYIELAPHHNASR